MKNVSNSKVLLAFIYNDQMDGTMEEIGLGIIASVLRDSGYEVKLLAANENEVNYTGILDFMPDIIGLTVYSISKHSVYNVISKIKRLLPSIFIVVGGVYATSSGKELLEENEMIDCVIRGEGEETFIELLQSIDSEAASAVRFGKYLYDYRYELNAKCNNTFRRYDFYSEIYPHFLGYYRHNFAYKSDTQALMVLKRHKEKYNEIQREFKFRCAQWIKGLRERVGSNWDSNEVGAYTDTCDITKNFMKVVNQTAY